MKNSKEICIVHLIGKSKGGVASVAKILMKEQISQDIQVVAVVTDEDEECWTTLSPDVYVIKVKNSRMPGRNILYGMGIHAIYDEVKHNFPDKKIVIHAHNTVTIGALTKLGTIPIVCTLHGVSVWKKECIRKRVSDYLVKKVIKKLLKKKNCAVVAVSNTTAKVYETNIEDRITIIYNGSSYANNVRDSDLKKTKFLVGHIGGVSYSKGWDVAEKAFELFYRKIDDNKAMMVSAGNVYLSEEEISRLVDGEIYSKAVENLGFIQDAGNKVIPTLDVMLLPSISEGLPMSIVEAFSYGVPVIASDVGGIHEIVKNGENGYLVNRDAKEIANLLYDIYSNIELQETLKKNAREFYEKYLTARRMEEKYEDIYASILKER